MTEFKIDNPAVLYLSGGTMVGVINQPNLPVNPLELTNKEYVDNLIASGVADATTTTKGKLQLSGDLIGTASTPLIAPMAVTNIKLANMSGVSQLKGSNSVNTAVTDIFLGNHLIMIGSTLNIDTISMPFLPLTGGTMSGAITQPLAPVVPNDVANKAYVDAQITNITVPDATSSVKGKIQLSGDLSGTANAPVIAPMVITSSKITNNAVLNSKLANMSGNSQLKGSSSTSSAVTDISLGSNLIMVGSTLNVNTVSLGSMFLPLSGGNMSGAITQPLGPVVPNDLTNKAYVDAQINSVITPDATTTIKGKIQLAGDLTGTSSLPTIAPMVITNSKIANNTILNSNLSLMSNTSQLKGSSSTSSDVTDISLGSGLSMSGTTLNVNTSSLSSTFLPLSGGTMSGAITQPLAPVVPNDVANKAYVDAQVASGTPDATTLIKGKVQLAGDLSGTASAPVIAPLSVTNAKLANLSAVSQLKGSSSASSTATDISLGSGLSMSGTTLNVNTSSLSSTFLPLSGGTMSGAITQPLAPVVPNDVANKAYVDAQVASGVPDATTLIKGKIQLAGDLSGTASAPVVAPLAITNAKLANLSGMSQLKGSSSTSLSATDISLGSGLSMSGTTLNVNTSSLSSTFLPLSGGTMSGAIIQPLAPVVPNDVANKAYVDAQVASSTPDATTLIKGKVQLAGDLSGTASAPVIAPLAVTNAKLANLSGMSQLKGSSSTSSAATDISLGSGLSMSGTVLNIDQTVFQKAGATQFGVVEFDSSGDLNETMTNSGIGVVKPLAITNSKINPGGASTLKGTNSINNVDDIILGSGLTLSNGINPTLSVNSSTLQKAGTTQFGVVEFDPSGDLNATSSNSGIGVVKPLAITNSKLANLSGTSQLKGSSSTSSTATDISLGSGLSMSGTTLSVDQTTLQKAGTTQFGVVEFDPSGDLSATSTNSGIGVVKPLAITNSKLANLSGTSQLKGSSSTSSAATDISLGAGLIISGNNLFIDDSTLQKAGATQFGVVEFDPSGDLSATSTNSGIGVVKPLAITNSKLANLSGNSQLKGSSSTSSTATDISLGSGLSMSGTTLSVDQTTLQKAGATQFGVVEFDPSGDLNATSSNSGIGVVKPLAITNPKINPGSASTLKGTNSLNNVDDVILGSGLTLSSGVGPTLSVNSSTLQKAGATQFGVVEFDPSGDLNATSSNSGIGVIKPLAITNSKLANLSAVSQLKGSSSTSSTATDISLGSGLSMSGTTLSVDQTTLQKAGNTQFGVVEFDPSGDLSATATNSGIGVVKPLAITNSKLANLSGNSQLKGSSSTSSAATDISLGSGLSMSSNILGIDQTTFQKAGNTQFGVVEFDPSGDLNATSSNSGIGVVKPLAITNSKLANLSGNSQLKGSSSTSSAAADISLGSGLSMSGTTLSVDQTTLQKAGNTQFGVVEFDPSGDLNATATNSGIGVVKPLAITNSKLANLSGNSQLKGSSSTSSAAADISLGSGLNMSGTTLNIQKAGTTQFGVVEFDPSGDLNATSSNSGIGVVKPLAITNPKINPGGASTLKGTYSLSNVDDVILGSGLTLSSGAGPTLSVNSSTLQKAGATQFGVVEFDPSGDLNATSSNSGIGVVKPLAITNPKINPGGASTLKGTNSLSNVDDVILGSGLTLSSGAGPTLSVNSSTLQKAGATQFGVVEFDPSGDLNATATNSGIGVVKPLAITNSKLANLSGNSQLKGSSSTSSAAADISLGSGLSMSGTVLNIDQTAFQKAGATQFGVVEI
ncbi:hypothetical protein IIV22_123L [Invertebrate iridescent virus 22]|uniref:Uncharacterized protein n=1 Tax=Invertebrate iridescent virus 22 TaxID=345198 RepID=S6DF76_9VIRU|nr:hypothetical protein IIV22_123L [Invertebrate iridescent virus 22]CCV01800.1 hypothetical protein IIV22_123L [Invertebrate iridescent virus 22]